MAKPFDVCAILRPNYYTNDYTKIQGLHPIAKPFDVYAILRSKPSS